MAIAFFILGAIRAKVKQNAQLGFSQYRPRLIIWLFFTITPTFSEIACV
jgi:hypothetical protein